MCIPGIDPVTLGMAASALGGVGQLINSQQALKRQDHEVARGIASRALLQREAGNRVQQQIADVAASNPDQERREQNNAFIDALRKAKVATGGEDLGAVAGASDRFAADVGQARTAAGAEGRALAGQLAAIDAPGLQRQREARSFNDAATDISLIGDRANSLDFLTQLRTQNAGRTNPWVDAAGQGLQAFGSVYAGRKQPTKPPRGPLVDTTGWKKPGGY